jgi:F-box and WD-40 domain protein MET30
MDLLPLSDRQAITHIWSLFSAAPGFHRKLILQGILSQCCFPQLSFISSQLHQLIRIDFIGALPSEISYKILSYLDAISLCKAAQVSRKWREMADDDIVWMKICQQHIDRKCTKCGWGLPLLERRRLRAATRAANAAEEVARTSASNTPIVPPVLPSYITEDDVRGPPEPSTPSASSLKRSADDSELAPDDRPSPAKRSCTPSTTQSKRPWKTVYSERCKIEQNWRHGRYSVKILRGHENGVMCLQASDDMLATGSYDCTIRLWDLETLEPLKTLVGHSRGITALQFDSGKLISASMDGTLRIWNYRLSTPECVSVLRGHTDSVLALHFDGKLLASGSADSTVRVWDYERKECKVFRAHKDWVNTVRITGNGKWLFSGSDDMTIKLWDIESGDLVSTFSGHVGQVQCIIPVPNTMIQSEMENEGETTDFQTGAAMDGLPRYILSSSLDNTIKLWHVPTGTCKRTLFGHVEGVWNLAADSLRVISGSQDRLVKVWDVESGKCEHTLVGHGSAVTCVGVCEERVFSGGEDGTVRVWDFDAL